MVIELTPEVEQLIAQKLQSGAFSSVEELIHQALVALPTPEPPAQEPRKHLADLLSEYPFAGAELDLERQRN